jgi:hypothetical protein
MSADFNADQDTITVRIPASEESVDKGTEKDLLYEAIRQGEPGGTKYRICGVWIPFGRPSHYKAGAFVASHAWIKSLTSSMVEESKADEAKVYAAIQSRVGTFI